MEVLLFMKNYIKSLFLSLFLTGFLFGLMPQTLAMEAAKKATAKDKISQLITSVPTDKLMALTQKAVMIALVDSLMVASNAITEDEHAKVLSSMSLGILLLISAKVAEKYNTGINSIKEILPSEVLNSHFASKPLLSSLLTATGFLHMYAQELGIPDYYFYFLLLGLKVQLFNDYKDAIGYHVTSGLYSLGGTLGNSVPGADIVKNYFAHIKSLFKKSN